MATTYQRFVTEAPRPHAAEAMDVVRKRFAQLAEFVQFNTPPGREQSLALTKLEEAKFWANQGIIVADNDAVREISAGEDE